MRSSSQILLSFLLSAIICVAALYVLFSLDVSQWKNVQAVRMQVAERQAVRDRLADLVSKFQERVAQFTDFDKQITSIGNALPSSMNIPELLATAEAIATKAKVSLDQITFTVVSQPQQSSGLIAQQAKPMKISLSVNVTGGYSGIKDFVSYLETEVRLMDVNTITMTPALGSPKTMQFSSHIDATTYYIAQPTFTLP